MKMKILRYARWVHRVVEVRWSQSGSRSRAWQTPVEANINLCLRLSRGDFSPFSGRCYEGFIGKALRQRCGSLIFKDNRGQNIGVRRSLTLQCPDSIQNGILLFLFDINEVHRSRVLCARRSSALNFVRRWITRTNARPEALWNWEGLEPRRFRWLP
jgi:hypothetical protein